MVSVAWITLDVSEERSLIREECLNLKFLSAHRRDCHYITEITW